MLDRMDGDTDHEDGADAEPSLAAPENREGSQVVYMRGGDQDHEVNTPEFWCRGIRRSDRHPCLAHALAGRGNIVLPWA